MATGGVTDQVGGRRGHMCVPCNRAGRQTLATVLCNTCGGHLCNDCCVKHITSAIGKHDIINIGDQRQEEVTTGIQHLDIDVEHGSDFVNTFRDTSNVTRPARLEHLMTLDLVKTEGDKEWPFVAGMDFLPDGRLAAVDCLNLKCFILDDKLRRKGLYNFEGRPLGVTCYNGDNMAVTLANSAQNFKAIALLSVSKSNNITRVRTLTTSFYCRSICPMDGDRFILSTFDHPRPIRTITVQGQEGDVQHAGLPDKTYDVGESRCTFITKHKIVVFMDTNAHEVYLSNIENGRYHIVHSDEIRSPKGACPGIDGTVFVCSAETGTVVQLTTQGTVLTSLDVSMEWPRVVSLSRDGTRLAVSNSAEGRTLIKLFKVSAS